MLGTSVQVVVMLHHTDRGSGTSHFMRPHVGPPSVLQNRKLLSLLSRGGSMWCLFFENSVRES